MMSEPVPPALVQCVDAVRAYVIEHVEGDTFLLREGRGVSLVDRETITRLLTGGMNELD
jgi:hypothetical protein